MRFVCKDFAVKKSKIFAILKISLIVLCAFIFTLFIINIYMESYAGTFILSGEDTEMPKNIDCILVLGASVHSSGKPSFMLKTRLLKSFELYRKGIATRLLMSGDNSTQHYNEVNVMRSFAVKHGILNSQIFTDHAGFSTYESCYRARDVFAVKRVVIVTQEYHLYRAVYTARKLGLEAYGVSAGKDYISGQSYRDLREFFARIKDFWFCLRKPEPKYLGPIIRIDGAPQQK